jgi:hypothetical protein
MNDRDHSRERDLVTLADELSTTLDELRDELAGTRRRPPRGPLGLPRPPTPRELLEFTDEFAIPAAIAGLEATIRTLELLQGAIRLTRAGSEAGERGREVRTRAEDASRRTVDRLDDVLVDLQDALAGRPENEEARTLLDDARALRREIDDRLADSRDRRVGGSPERDERRSTERRRSGDGPRSADERRPTGWAAGAEREAGDDGVAIDVDAELDSIREEIEGAGDADKGDVDDGRGDGSGEGDSERRDGGQGGRNDDGSE